MLARWLRGLAALASILVLGVTAYLMLMWGPSRQGWVARAGVWAIVASLPVPVAAFPPVSAWLKPRGLRWVLAPSTFVALTMCVGLTYDALARGFIDEHVPLIVLPTLPCALYVAWCLLLPVRPPR